VSQAGGEFTAQLLALFEAIHPLDRVPRAGFLLRGVAEPESVSAHAHFLAVMALLFCERFPEYDKARVLAMAIVHDLPEARLMDIPMPYADAYLSDAKHRAEQAIADDLFEHLPGGLAALHQEFTDASTPEARLLRALDKAQMMVKVLCYERERRGNLHEFWENPKNFNDYGIAAVSELFDAICARAGRVRPA
jgi:putative hydrolase of HD superfamily